MSGDVGLHGPAKWQSTNDDRFTGQLSIHRVIIDWAHKEKLMQRDRSHELESSRYQELELRFDPCQICDQRVDQRSRPTYMYRDRNI